MSRRKKLLDLPKYVSREPDRHGNERFYYRRDGRRTRLRSAPGTLAFQQEIMDAALIDDPAPPTKRYIGSYVYFITFGPKRVKIGTCRNVKSRFQALRTGMPGKGRVHYVTPGDARLERYLHELFGADRITGEWFQHSKPIRDWIETDQERRKIERQVRTES